MSAYKDNMTRKEFVKAAAVGAMGLAMAGGSLPVKASGMTFEDNLKSGVVTGVTPPASTDCLWIDTSSGEGIAKYYNGTEWTAIKAVWG